MASFNNITPGYPWAQIFSFPAGALAIDEDLRASFRHNPASEVLFVVDGPAAIIRDGDNFNVQVDAAQTSLLADTDRVSFDFYAIKAGVARALQVRVHVPVRVGL